MKKRRFLILSVSLFALCLIGLFLSGQADRIAFRRLTGSFFSQSLEQDPLSLHFTLADPAAFGISSDVSTLPVYSSDAAAQTKKSCEKMLEKLSHIRPDKLKEEEQYTYDLLCSWLRLRKQEAAFPYYEEPLSPSSGMHCELPLLFAEYTLRNRDDVRNYLSLLESAAPYLQGLADYETNKAQAGLFMTEEDAKAAAAQCDAILDEASLSDGTHFLQTTFRERLEKLLSQQLITAKEMEQYLSENNRLLTTVLLPAYQKLGDSLLLLSGSGRYDGGLAELPDGRAYYAWLAASTTGSCLNVEDMYTLLQKTFQKKLREYKALFQTYRSLTDGLPDPAQLSGAFPLTEPTEILRDLRERMQADFPPFPQDSAEQIDCLVKDVDRALEPFTSPAFYMSPPIDDLAHNTICVNRSSTADGIELYTTLAHEGYPGHLYQTVYSSLYTSIQNRQPVRELLFYGGYVEGWAYYTERIAYEYAAQLLSDGDPDSPRALLCRMISLQRDLQINLFSLLDISLHYYGAAREDILRSLTSFGLPEESALQIYDYLRTSPASYLKYYVGYLEMTALRERARALWGEDFSLMRFHRFVLEAGPSDFPNLVRRLKKTSAKPSLQTEKKASRPFFLYSILFRDSAISMRSSLRYMKISTTAINRKVSRMLFPKLIGIILISKLTISTLICAMTNRCSKTPRPCPTSAPMAVSTTFSRKT